MNKGLHVIASVVALSALCGLLGCSPDGSTMDLTGAAPGDRSAMKMMAEPMLMQESQAAGDQAYLAYEHSITVAMAAADIAAAHQQLADQCTQLPLAECTLMASNLQAGEISFGHLRMRIPPARVEPLLAKTGALGQVTSRDTHVDDLQNVIVDNAKRIEMLLSYRDKLQALEQTSAKEVDGLIRIASELSRVQSDLEYAQGEKSRLLQRVDFQVVNIHLQTLRYDGFWSPIADALGDFGEQLARGASSTLRAIAYGLPGFGLFLLIVGLLRWYWRRLP